MKNLKKIIWITVFTTAILFFNSCEKEDTILPQHSEENIKDDKDNDNNGQQSNNKNEGEITLYSVANGKLTKTTDYKVTGTDLDFQNDVEKHNQIWELVKKVVPLNQLEKMSEFMIYNGNSSGTAGYVVEKTKDLSKWQMGIAIDFAFQGGFNHQGELAYTIIHEFGHILTLNDNQLNASISESNCKNYFPGEGCAKKESYINELFQNYWKDIADEHSNALNDQNAQEEFYSKYSDRFVTNYASTNPGEDVAEVFATFVTKKEKPSGATIAEKKILLMYNRSELVDFRNHIRKNLKLRKKGKGVSFELPKPGAWKQANTYGTKSKCRH